MNINSLLPTDSQANQNAVSIQLEKKWEKTGLLEGMNENGRQTMARLLENQAQHAHLKISGQKLQAGHDQGC